MHSYIFQISNEPIKREDFIGIDQIEAGDMASIDYAYETGLQERKECIQNLMGHVLPKGMFDFNMEEDALVFKGGYAKWEKNYLEAIRTKMAKIDESNIMKWTGPVYQLQKTILNPLDSNVLFVTEFHDGSGTAELSAEFMRMVCNLQIGERLYIGAVFGYHL